MKSSKAMILTVIEAILAIVWREKLEKKAVLTKLKSLQLQKQHLLFLFFKTVNLAPEFKPFKAIIIYHSLPIFFTFASSQVERWCPLLPGRTLKEKENSPTLIKKPVSCTVKFFFSGLAICIFFVLQFSSILIPQPMFSHHTVCNFTSYKPTEFLLCYLPHTNPPIGKCFHHCVVVAPFVLV